MPHQLIITLVYKVTLCRRLCQILYVKCYSFTVFVFVLVLAIFLVSLTSLHAISNLLVASVNSVNTILITVYFL